MRTNTLRTLVGAAVLVALGGTASALEGQSAPPPPRVQIPAQAPQSPPQPPAQVRLAPLALMSVATGWLGIRVRYEITETTVRFPAAGSLAGGGRVASTAAGSATGSAGRTDHVVVEEVLADGPARTAGMAAGDRIIEINGVAAGRAIEQGILSAVRPAQVVRFGIDRDGRQLRLDVVAVPRPAAVTPGPTPLTAAPERRAWVASRPGFPVELSAAREEGRIRSETATQVLRALVSGGAEGAAARDRTMVPGPILVYATGQRAVLGAELTPLNAGLSGYFGVDAGLLVTQVVEGAPAYRGGLIPCDVIVRVGSSPVASIEEVRAAAEVGLRSPPLVLGVVREGRRLELRIPR